MPEALDQPRVVDLANRILVRLRAHRAVTWITFLCLGWAGFLLRVRHGSASFGSRVHCTGYGLSRSERSAGFQGIEVRPAAIPDDRTMSLAPAVDSNCEFPSVHPSTFEQARTSRGGAARRVRLSAGLALQSAFLPLSQ